MEIKFIGNGSGFSETNNNAFFEYKDELILIDCSMLNMNRIKSIFDFKKYNTINIFVTHMHADHISGLPNLIQFLFHAYNIICNVMIPDSLKNDLINVTTFINNASIIPLAHSNEVYLSYAKASKKYNNLYEENISNKKV